MLAAWRQRATDQLTARLESATADARSQVADVLSLPFGGRAAAGAARIELAIRAWARRNAMARQRAFLCCSYLIAESLLHDHGSATQRAERRRFVERLLQQTLG